MKKISRVWRAEKKKTKRKKQVAQASQKIGKEKKEPRLLRRGPNKSRPDGSRKKKEALPKR